MYSKQLKGECLKLFISGTTLNEISKLKNIPFQTVHTWHARSKWAEIKAENETKAKQEIQKEALEDTKKNIRLFYKENKKQKLILSVLWKVLAHNQVKRLERLEL